MQYNINTKEISALRIPIPAPPPTRVRCPGVSSGAVEGGAAGVFGETGRALRLPPAPRLPGGTMTLGRDILYAALTGLMHGGLTIYPAQWAGLRCRAVGAVGRACNRQSRLSGWARNVAPLALWGGRETSNRQCRPSACQAGWKHIAPLALWSRPRAVIPQPKASPWVCEISMILCGLKGRVNPAHHATIIIAHPGSPDFQHERPCPCIDTGHPLRTTSLPRRGVARQRLPLAPRRGCCGPCPSFLRPGADIASREGSGNCEDQFLQVD